ncbi:MAG: hypothetical protein R2811_05740 [Flavobacteriales bacterium]
MPKTRPLPRTNTIAKTLSVAGSGMAFATVNGDNGLAEAMNITPASCVGIGIAQSRSAMGVHDAAMLNAAALVSYGVAAGDIVDLKARIDKRSPHRSHSRATKITARKGVTAEIGAPIRDTMKLLNYRIDRLMQQFAFSHKEFHKQ